ncbi:MAG: HlyD family efflux transporter periplasmic adaptor subunit [Lentisphaeria bacterium]|nr:HlyD family efflux transporter periplasmic adaptor subunit [Lentisphaeria bacterium]
MKKVVIPVLMLLLGIAGSVAVFLAMDNGKESKCEKTSPLAVPAPREIIGYGYLRGNSQYALKNKYGAFVSKVNIYSYNRVKKGDCILEYDDFDLRCEITDAENAFAQLEKDLALKQTQLELVKVDPLPSDYRNINWKVSRAKELLARTENEWRVYQRLFRNKSVSDLDLRDKKQAYYDALAAYRITVADQEKVSRGLRKFYLLKAEQEVEAIKTKIENAKKELALLQEKRKYYKIIAPHDGIIKTHSDTVGAWNAAATEAACLHKEKYYKLYAYFAEEDIPFIKNGMKARFFSHDSGKWYDATAFELTRSRTAVGDGVYHLVKFRVTSDMSKDLKVSGKGTVNIEGAVTVKFEL